MQERYDGKHNGSLLSRGLLLVCHHLINDEVGTIAFKARRRVMVTA